MFVVAIGWYDSHRFLQLGPWRQLFQVCLRKYVDSGSRVIAKLQYLVDCSRGDVEVCLLAALYTKLVTPSDSSSSLRWCTFLFGLCLYLAGGSGWSVCWGAGHNCPHAGWERQTEEKLFYFMHVLQWQLYAGQLRWPSGCGHVPPELWHFCWGWFGSWWCFVSVLT